MRAALTLCATNPSPNRLAPGTRVTVTQQVQKRRWTTEVTGAVLSFEQRKTGSWYAHGKDDRLWLDRLTLQKDDGEIVTLNLDRYSHLEHAGSGETLGRDATLGQTATPGVEAPDRKVHPGRAEGAIQDRSNPAPSFDAPVPQSATVPEAQAAPAGDSSGGDAPAKEGVA